MSSNLQLVDQHGRALAASSFRAASRTDKDFRNWNPMNLSGDTELLGELSTLVGRSRDLIRNNGVAGGYVQTLVDNIIGTGLRLSAKPNYIVLGKDKKWADEWAKKTEAHFRDFAESMSFDVERSVNFHGASIKVLRAGVGDGESLALPYWLKRSFSKWRTCFRIVDCDRLSNPNNAPESDTLRGGIEFDRWSAPKAYHIRSRHPGDFLASDVSWERIPAYTRWGRRRVLHVHDAERTGQTRGKPITSSVMAPFKMVDHYQLVELRTNIVNSLIAAFVESSLDSQGIAELFGSDPSAYIKERNSWEAQLQGGAIIQMPVGDRMTAFTPNRQGAAFADFVEFSFRQIAAGLHIPYELLMKDFSKTNYSSARAALLEAWRFFTGRKQWLGTYWASPVYELWLEEAVNKGIIDAPGFYKNREAYCRCKWMGAAKGWVDPTKEASASKLRRSALISTLEDECAEQNKDWEEVLEQAAREKEKLRELGLTEEDVQNFLEPQVNPKQGDNNEDK